MTRDGDMVRGDGRLMRVIQTFHEFAKCVWIDAHGGIRAKWFDIANLMPLEAAIRPRSLWPQHGQVDIVEIERQERAALAEVAAEKAKRRKPGRSNKLKRKAAA